MSELDGRPGNQIKPPAPEPEYVKRRVPVRNLVHPGDSKDLAIDLIACTRCGSYVWDLQAHEKSHGVPPCCGGGPQWGHAWSCPKCPD